MGLVETVKIVADNKDGYIVINAGDKSKTDKIFKEKKETPKKESEKDEKI